MSESTRPKPAVISQELMLQRIAQFEQTRESLIQMWLQNPELVKHLEPKIQDLFKPLPIIAPEGQEPW